MRDLIRRWKPPRLAAAAFLLLGTTDAAAPPPDAQPREAPPVRAWRLLDLASGRTLDEGRPDVLARPVPAGSIVKIATLIAALEAGVIAPDTRMACPGSAEVGGRRITCLHPRVRHALSPEEALAHSCNVFFGRVGQKLPRARLDRVLAELGLPRAPVAAPPALAATGIESSPVAPEALLRAMVRIVSDPPGVNMRAPTRATVMRGLRQSAQRGTASALAGRGVDALAKTGTGRSADGGPHGVTIAAWPAARPSRAAVVTIAGVAGPAATEVLAELARAGRLPPAPPTGAPVAVPPVPTAGPARPPPPRTPAATPSAPTPPAGAPADAASSAPAGSSPGAPSSRAPAGIGVRVGQARGAGYVSREMELEEYVAHVIAGEAAPRSTPAVLEALAITIRTFALANRGRHARDGFDLCDLTHCQVLRPPDTRADAAAAATRGLVLGWHGAPAQVFYTASCGGRSERPSEVWSGSFNPPFLPSRRDEGCRGEPRWSADISVADLSRALAAAGYRGTTVRDLRVTRRSDSGRATVLRVSGFTPGEISGQDLRMAIGRTLGWHLVKSTSFDLSRARRGYRFTGRGYGHGVGMCVIGATNRSAQGWSRERLLETYFPGLAVVTIGRLARLAPGGETIAPASAPVASGEARALDPRESTAAPAPAVAPAHPPRAAAAPSPGRMRQTRVRLIMHAQDEAERARLAVLIEQRLANITARAGRPGPREIQVVVQPTSGAFQRVTGEPEWSSGSTRGARIDLQPLRLLRERGTLEETLAHELGHVVTNPVTRGRRAWVIEGAAMYVGGLLDPWATDAVTATAATACPADRDLRDAPTAAAARDALTRARACFARALAGGTSWHEVR